MKTNFYILTGIVSLLGVQLGASQPTITVQNLPQPGYTYITITDTMPSISLGTAGPLFQTWDFTTLDSHYPSVPTFDLTSQTPYAADFPSSNIYTWGPAAMFGGFFGGTPVSSVGYATGYMFWKTDVTGYWIIGFRADSGEWAGVNVYENPVELLVGTPCSYSDVDNNTARWELPLGNKNPADYDTFYVNTVIKTLTADAWGYLQLPNGIGDTILRIHEYLIRIDSTVSRMGSVFLAGIEIYRDTLNNYLYMSTGYNYPLAQVHADKNNNLKSVEYYLTSTVLSAGTLPGNHVSVNIFPNPAGGGEIHIGLPDDINGSVNTRLKIYSVSGTEMLDEPVSNGRIIIRDASSLEKGTYIYSIFDGNRHIATGKIIIQ